MKKTVKNRRSKPIKRILALVLSIVLEVSSLPLPALAAETAEDAASVEAHALPAEVPNEEIRESTALPTDVTEAPAPEEAEGTSETAESPESAAPVAEEPAAKAQPEVIASGTCGMGLAWSLPPRQAKTCRGIFWKENYRFIGLRRPGMLKCSHISCIFSEYVL